MKQAVTYRDMVLEGFFVDTNILTRKETLYRNYVYFILYIYFYTFSFSSSYIEIALKQKNKYTNHIFIHRKIKK